MLLLLIVLVLALLILYSKLRYFTVRPSVAGLSPHLYVGNLIQAGILFQGKSLSLALHEFQHRFGQNFQFWLGPSRYFIVGNLEDVQHVFTHRNVYDQGDVFIEKISVLFPGGLGCIKGAKFRRHLAVTGSMFRRANIISNLDLIVQCTDQLIDHWRQSWPTGTVHTNIVHQSKNLLLNVFGFIAFDYDLEMFSRNHEHAPNELTRALQDLLSIYSVVIYSPRTISLIYLTFSLKYRRARRIIHQYFNQMIDHELTQTSQSRAERKRTCLIASLVAALQADEKAAAMQNESEQKGLSRSEILNEMLLFLVAGYESTSSAFAWFIHLMSKHPDVQQKIKAELPEKGNLTIEQLDSMVYLDCVIKEVFRFCPPAAGTARTLKSDDRLPNSDIQLYRGDSIFIPFYNLSHDSRYWSIDPDRFYPDRFLNEDKNHHPLALIPFGGGHRQCVAKDLAQFELKVIAARLMQCLTFGDAGEPINSGEHYARITVMPKRVGVTVHFD